MKWRGLGIPLWLLSGVLLSFIGVITESADIRALCLFFGGMWAFATIDIVWTAWKETYIQ